MTRIRQSFDVETIGDVESHLRAELTAHPAVQALDSGAKVAIAVGSRGIAEIDTMLRTLVDVLTARGASPFVVPAMGSQGGATAIGQAKVLEHLGITEERISAPVISTEDVVCIGQTSDQVPVYCDKLAAEADALICVNRIKPHTAFRSNIESGLMKMLSVGLGKRLSAQAVHSAPGGLARGIVQGARAIMKNLPVKLGIAVVENSNHKIARLVALPPAEFEETETRLLLDARRMMATLPFDELDVLILDEIGKDISGAGMDPNVIGMGRRLSEMIESTPRISRIVALSLTEASQGNAEGIGLADIISQRLLDRVDLRTTYINCITSGFLRGGMIPITCETDREAIGVALEGFPMGQARVARIRNTRDIEELDVSSSILPDLLRSANVTQLGEGKPLRFTPDGVLL